MTEYKIQYQLVDGPKRSHTDLKQAIMDLQLCQHNAFKSGDTQGIWLVAVEDGIERPFTDEERAKLLELI